MDNQPVPVLDELRNAAAARRDARRCIADLTAEHGRQAADLPAAWVAYRAITDRWSALIRRAALGHTLADVARAAGCARPSLYRHLR